MLKGICCASIILALIIRLLYLALFDDELPDSSPFTTPEFSLKSKDYQRFSLMKDSPLL